MNVHKNARLTVHSRAELVRRLLAGQTPKAVAAAFGVDPKTAAKWVRRFRAEGLESLADRSSRPRRLRRPTSAAVQDQIIALRRQRWTGQQIAREAGVSPATVSRILRRAARAQGRAGPPTITRRGSAWGPALARIARSTCRSSCAARLRRRPAATVGAHPRIARLALTFHIRLLADRKPDPAVVDRRPASSSELTGKPRPAKASLGRVDASPRSDERTRPFVEDRRDGAR